MCNAERFLAHTTSIILFQKTGILVTPVKRYALFLLRYGAPSPTTLVDMPKKECDVNHEIMHRK